MPLWKVPFVPERSPVQSASTSAARGFAALRSGCLTRAIWGTLLVFTYSRPGSGANWGGGALDPETGLLYGKTSNVPHIARVQQPDRSAANPRPAGVDAEWTGDLPATEGTLH